MDRWQRLSRCLALPECEGATADWWERRLGAAPSAWGGLLDVSGKLAECVPCGLDPASGCQRRVERHNDEVFFAACEHVPGSCAPIKLTRAELLLHKVSLPRLLPRLREVFGLVEPASPGGLPAPIHAGDAHLRPDLRIPVYLLLGRVCACPSWSLRALDPSKPAALLAPTAEVASRLPKHGQLRVFVLEGMLGADRRGLPTLTEAGRGVWESWKQEYCPSSVDGVVRFPTPPDANWSHVTLGLGADDHTLSIHVRTPTEERSGAFHISRLGMMKNGGSPSDSWKLLSGLIRSGGWHESSGKRYQEKMKMPMKRLRDSLKEIFAIASQPIRWDRHENAWVTEFHVRGERA
jgi:hypothetical protein